MFDIYTDVKNEEPSEEASASMTDTPAAESASKESPVTGDRTNNILAFLIMFDSGLAALYLMLRKRMLK